MKSMIKLAIETSITILIIVSIPCNSLHLISGTVINIYSRNNIIKTTIDMYDLTLDNWIFTDILSYWSGVNFSCGLSIIFSNFFIALIILLLILKSFLVIRNVVALPPPYKASLYPSNSFFNWTNCLFFE